MEKPNPLQHQQHPQQQQQQEALKCPRCESSNTKFCYYNNYALSQPRHFCKACKRYWTRGGTLRNVPVGGGCRKNKRAKRPIHVSTTSAQVDRHHNTNPISNPNLDHNPSPTPTNNSSNHHLNPLFYGLNPNFPRYNNTASGYDFVHPNMSDLGLGFSSPLATSHVQNSNSTFPSYPTSMYGAGSTSSSATAPTMAALLASSRQQLQRFVGFAPYDDGGGPVMKDLIMEGKHNRVDWINNFHGQNHSDQVEAVRSSDPNSDMWNTAAGNGGGNWLDPTTNIGSSVPSL